MGKKELAAAVGKDASLDGLISDFANAKQRLAGIQADEKEQQEVVKKTEAQLFDALEDEGLRSVKADDLGTFGMNDLAWAKIEDRALALAWADENKPEMLTLNHMQLSMVVREALKGEGEIPPGVDFTTSRKISWRKASK